TYTYDAPTSNCDQTVVVTFTAYDNCQNMGTATKTFTVDDNTAPVVTDVPVDVIIACGDTYEFDDPTVTDNCDPDPALYYSRDDGRDLHDPYFEPGTVTEICFWAYDDCGNQSLTHCFTVTAEQCEMYCTMTQGFYGNAGGLYCDQTSTGSLLESLIADSLVIGYYDNNIPWPLVNNTMRFYPGNADCIIQILPGGGPSKAISGINTCVNGYPGVQQSSSGASKNALFSQTLTLALNLRLSPDLALQNMYEGHLRTAASVDCDPDAPAAGLYQDYQIPAAVINELQSNPSYENTVQGLLDLANAALGGQVANGLMSQITEACSVIAEAFDECAFGYFVEEYSTTQPSIPSNPIDNTISSFVDNMTLKASPNPFNEVANIEFSVPMTVRVSLDVYTLQGQKVETLYTGMADEDVIHSYKFHAEGIHGQATYVYVLRTVYGTKFGKLILIK
ncbi:MAG: hypothetical protein ABFS05_08965, partial [Bacteroidota bacterium]